MRRQLAAAQAGEAGAAPSGSQPGSGGQSPHAAGTPRSSGIVNAGTQGRAAVLHQGAVVARSLLWDSPLIEGTGML